MPKNNDYFTLYASGTNINKFIERLSPIFTPQKQPLMRNCLLALIILFISSCKDKKADLSGDAPVKVNDFVAAFPIINLPYNGADTNITSLADTTIISYKVMAQFIPDSAMQTITGKEKKIAINPIGRIEKAKETYLLANFVVATKTHLVTFVLDKKNKFLTSRELLSDADKDGYIHSLSINKEPTFTIAKEKMDREKQQLQYTRTGWAYNGDGGFMQVVNETNEDVKKNNTITNPIDTLQKKNKYSGNYIQDNKNFITVRDGKTPNSYLFFIHFEKNEGNCIGELKGELQMKTANKAVYSDNGDPCLIDFTFNGNEITIKEQGSCGNHRDIKCFFDDSFTKKKEAVKKKTK